MKIKPLLLYAILLLLSLDSLAQNVGIGTTSPGFPLDVNGRMRLRYGGGPAGIWFNRNDNVVTSAFMGNYGDSMIALYNSDQSLWKIFLDHKNARIGINKSDAHAPLSFSNTAGNKISFYGDLPGYNYGVGIQSGLLQLYSVNDIAFGLNGSDNFTELLRIKAGGQVGINSNPANYSKLHVHVGSSQVQGLLITGVFQSNGSSTVPDLGGGSRLMYYPAKSAFRAGWVVSTEWNNSNVGFSSVGMGESVVASGENSTAFGDSTRASAEGTTAMGILTRAESYCATAMGYGTQANGNYSTAMGIGTIASTYGSTALGFYNAVPVSGNPIFMVGNGDNAANRRNALVVEEDGDVGIGPVVPLTKLDIRGGLLVTGNMSASFSGALWSGTFPGGGGMQVTTNINGNTYLAIQRDGGGASLYLTRPSHSSSGYLAEFFVGGTAIGSIFSTGTGTDYNSVSDSRFKENIIATKYGLNTLLKIEVKDYAFINDPGKGLHTGFLAQDLYKLYPQAVTPGGEDLNISPWMIDYGKLTPLLVKSIQEQNVIIREQQKQIQDLKEAFQQLVAEVRKK